MHVRLSLSFRVGRFNEKLSGNFNAEMVVTSTKPGSHMPAHPVLSFEFSTSTASSFFLYISSQGREEAKTGTPAGRFDPYY